MSNEESKPCKHCGKLMYKKPTSNEKMVTNFNWLRRMFCDHRCRSAHTNAKYAEETRRLLSVKKECRVCHEDKPLYAYKLTSGVRSIVCKKCASAIMRGGNQWKVTEGWEMKRVKKLREVMAGLPVSHSMMPNSLEPFVSLRVYLDM